MIEKMFQSDSPPAVYTGASARPRTGSLQRGLSFAFDHRKLVEASDKWRTFLKQLHERRKKIYKIVNILHDQRLSEQGGV